MHHLKNMRANGARAGSRQNTNIYITLFIIKYPTLYCRMSQSILLQVDFNYVIGYLLFNSYTSLIIDLLYLLLSTHLSYCWLIYCYKDRCKNKYEIFVCPQMHDVQKQSLGTQSTQQPTTSMAQGSGVATGTTGASGDQAGAQPTDDKVER